MMVLCMFAESCYPILSQLCATVDSRYGERFQFFLEGGYPRLQLASNSLTPHTRSCGQKRASQRNLNDTAIALVCVSRENSIIKT